ncbi:alpha/beta fold hydrolase [Spirosoma aerophilum]
MRLIFIPGFGEDAEIFNRITPELPGEKLFIHNLDILGSEPDPALTVMTYAQRLIDRHTITREDILIGHSMGGWVAYSIKHLIDCPVVQIASWTDPKKVVARFKNPEHAYWLVRKGWYLNSFTKQLLLWISYRGKPSAEIFGRVFQNLINSPREYIVNQLSVIMNPVDAVITVEPELRIHARKDSIIRFPDQSAVIVPGDHFTLITHPQSVITPIITFLTTYSNTSHR